MFTLSAENLKGALVKTVEELSTYDLLNADNLLLSESSIEKIENYLN